MLDPIINCRSKLGENPLWDSSNQKLYWTDIDEGKLYEYDLNENKYHKIYDGEKVGGFTLQNDGNLLLFRINDIVIFNLKSKKFKTVVKIKNKKFERFNDVIATPNGTVYAGTTGKGVNTGGFYKLNKNEMLEEQTSKTRISNGFAFNSDKSKMFWSDSTAKIVFVFDYNFNKDYISNKKIFVEYSKDVEVVPDAITLDIQDNLYIAKWGGFGVDIFDKFGKKISEIDLPTEKVTSVQFGGLDMRQIFIRTAGGKNEGIAGSIFSLDNFQKGRDEFRSSILL
jgi:D-xylono/L-arabinono-1,4-lactonase